MVTIRVASPVDEPPLTDLEAATWSTAASPGPPPDPARRFFDHSAPADVLVAVDGEEIVGSLILGPWSPLASARHTVAIKGLAVTPARQGEGIGSLLLAAAIERCREEGKRRLVLRVLSSNPGALRLYEGHGFVIEGVHREAFLIDGAYVDDLTMALDLTPGPALTTETVVGVDVGGRRKGFHACAIRGPRSSPVPSSSATWRAPSPGSPPASLRSSPSTARSTCAPPGERSRPDERALNRAVCGIRWTPERSALAGNPYYEWVEHGLELYAALAAAGIDRERTIEVFPTAAWTIWAGPRDGRPRGAWSADALADLGLDGVPDRSPDPGRPRRDRRRPDRPPPRRRAYPGLRRDHRSRRRPSRGTTKSSNQSGTARCSPG